jgi:phosphoesterase RecJ-like protein
MYHLLRGLGKDVAVYSQDEIPPIYRFLPGVETIVHSLGSLDRFDAAILLDCSEIGRVGTEAPRIGSIGRLITIDHHLSNQDSSSLALIDRAASSTGELLFRLIERMGLVISKDIAVNLYTAIMTDTGSFRYSNTGADTFRLAAVLVERGVDPHIVAQNVYESKPLVQIKLMERALRTLELDIDGRAASIFLNQKMMREEGAKQEHTEGFVDMIRSIEGVDVAIFCYEMPDGQYKISLRSKGAVNIERVARVFGGGGHLNAAACRASGDFGEIKKQLLESVRASMEEADAESGQAVRQVS